MKRGALVFCLLILLLLVPGALADFQVLNHSIQKNYLGGEKLEGSITISLKDISADINVSTSFGQSISLLDWFKLSNFKEGKDYNCSTLNCLRDYSKKQDSSINSLSLLQEGERKIVGFNLIGDNVELEELDLGITSDAAQSCVRNLLVDVGNSDSAFLQSGKYTNESCEPLKDGCFDENLDSYQEGLLGSSVYCEKIQLPVGPAYRLGANVANSTLGTGIIKMDMFCEDLRNCGSCNLPLHSKNVESLSCIVNHTGISLEKYFVCISSSGGNYKIKFETSGQLCGTDQISGKTLDRDYDIFAQSMRFDNIGINFGGDEFIDLNGEGIVGYVNSYLLERYGGDCSGKGCFIPFELSGVVQTIFFQEPNVKYTWGSTTLQNDDLFLLEESDSLINSGKIELKLKDAGFEVPLTGNNQTLSISLGGDSLIEGIALSITPSFSFDISPKFALIGNPTQFVVISNKNISSSSWNFGDGSLQESDDGKIIHSYSQAGDYEVEVNLESDSESARRKFKVIVGDPQLSAERLLGEYDARVITLEKSLLEFPSFVKNEIEQDLGIANLKAALVKMRNEFEVASSESDFIRVVENLISLDIPLDIGYSLEGNFPGSIGFGDIEVSYIEELAGEDIDDSDLKVNIVDWMGENYDFSLEMKIVTLFKENENENLVTYFKIDIDDKDKFEGNAYFIIDFTFEGITFKENYGQKSVNSGAQIILTGDKVVEFIIPGEAQASELGMYIASSQVFDIGNEEILDEEEPFRTFGFFGWSIILLIAFIMVYILLQEWYKKHYENYLFPKKDDLYNLIAFIRNSKKAGLDDSAIRANLSKSGWNGEHINYGFKKSEGRGTGMWDLPFFRFFEKRKVDNEMTNRASTNFVRPIMPRPPVTAESIRFIKQ